MVCNANRCGLSATATFTSIPRNRYPYSFEYANHNEYPNSNSNTGADVDLPPTKTPEPTFTRNSNSYLDKVVLSGWRRWRIRRRRRGGGTGSTKPCLAAKLVRDITIPEGQWLTPGNEFRKSMADSEYGQLHMGPFGQILPDWVIEPFLWALCPSGQKECALESQSILDVNLVDSIFFREFHRPVAV